LHGKYLKEQHPARYNNLVLSCQLWSYLADVNEQAQERVQIITKQMQEAETVTEELKAKDQWEWVRRMNSIRNRAEEIVLDEIIYR
jgi:DNA helicase IV